MTRPPPRRPVRPDEQEPDPPRATLPPARWIEAPVSRQRLHIVLCWPGATPERYREFSDVGLIGDDLFDPRTLRLELLHPPALAAHHVAQAHHAARDDLDAFIWECNAYGEPHLWLEAVHRCRSTSQWYATLPWIAVDPTAPRRRSDGPPPPPAGPTIPTHCPVCATPTVHDEHAHVFMCPACAWHD